MEEVLSPGGSVDQGSAHEMETSDSHEIQPSDDDSEEESDDEDEDVFESAFTYTEGDEQNCRVFSRLFPQNSTVKDVEKMPLYICRMLQSFPQEKAINDDFANRLYRIREIWLHLLGGSGAYPLSTPPPPCC